MSRGGSTLKGMLLRGALLGGIAGAIFLGMSLLTSGSLYAYSAASGPPVLINPLVNPTIAFVGVVELLVSLVISMFLFRGHVAWFIFALVATATVNIATLAINVIVNTSSLDITTIFNAQAATILISAIFIFLGAFAGSVASIGRKPR